jgi:hypothetical protein
VFVPASGVPLSSTLAASQAGFSHQPGYSLPGAAYSQSPELGGMDARVAVDLTAPMMDLSDPLGELSVLPAPL